MIAQLQSHLSRYIEGWAEEGWNCEGPFKASRVAFTYLYRMAYPAGFDAKGNILTFNVEDINNIFIRHEIPYWITTQRGNTGLAHMLIQSPWTIRKE